MKLNIVITRFYIKKTKFSVVIRCSDTFVVLDSGYRNLFSIESPTSEICIDERMNMLGHLC